VPGARPRAFVAVLVIELHFPEAASLKAKRRELAPVKAFLANRVGAAVSEVGYQDTWQRSLISAVTVSSDRVRAEQVLQAVEAHAASVLGGALTGSSVEWI